MNRRTCPSEHRELQMPQWCGSLGGRGSNGGHLPRAGQVQPRKADRRELSKDFCNWTQLGSPVLETFLSGCLLLAI